jgi:hypothetical protein
MRHPQRWGAGALGGLLLLIGGVSVATLLLGDKPLALLLLVFGGGGPALIALYARAQRCSLRLEDDGHQLLVRIARWPRRARLVRVDLAAIERVWFEAAASNYRVALCLRGGGMVALAEEYDLGGRELRREIARVHRFLLPGHPLPELPYDLDPGAPAASSGLWRLVAALVSVFAACGGFAVYGLKRKLSHSQTAEATRNLAVIEHGAREAFSKGTAGPDGARIHAFCPSAPQVPDYVPRAAKTFVSPEELRADGWRCLGFELRDPVLYAYRFESNYPVTGSAAVFTATAMGDLDGDGEQSTFILVGRGTNTGEYRRESFRIVNEEE